MSNRRLLLLSLGLLGLTQAHAVTLLQETFEAAGTNYTASEECTDGSGDYFTRTDGSNIGSFVEITGFEGSSFWAAQDTNGTPCTLDVETLTFDPIDVSGFTNLTVSLLVAEDQSSDGNEDWDDNSAFIVEFSYDGGANYSDALCFASVGSGFNTEPAHDTDCDGTGDGAFLTPAMADFTGSITDGTSLTVRLRADQLADGDEDVAFDNLRIDGDPLVATPPQLSTTDPADMATALDPATNITLSFDSSIIATAAAVTLDCGTGPLAFTGLPATAEQVVIDPTADLPSGASCTVTLVADEIQDGAANTLDGNANGTAEGSPTDDVSFSFQVQTDPPPQVTSTVPADGAMDVSFTSTLTINFNEPVDLATDAVTLDCDGPIALAGLPASSVSSIELTPQTSLPALTTCTLTAVASLITDVDGGSDPLDGDADGTGGDNLSVMFTTSVGACGDPATLISAIQGPGSVPNRLGETVSVEAIVVGDYQDDTGDTASDVTMLEGFYIQEEDSDADADAMTSEGILIFEDGPAVTDVAVGDRVRVIGTVSDQFNQTRLTNPTVSICDSNNTVTPATVALPRMSADEYEAVEGMLVQFEQTLTISNIDNLIRFGEFVASDGRLPSPTNVAMPGNDANSQDAMNALNQLFFEDGRSGVNNQPFVFDYTADNAVRSGDTLTNPQGVMSFDFSAYRLRPVGDGYVLNGENPRQPTPAANTGSIRVVAYNVENYFSTIDTGGDCGPVPQNCRGADTPTELARQQAKLSAAITAMDADIVGLVEIENNASLSLSTLVDAVNTAAGEPGRYTFIDTGLIGDDVIKVGFIYKPATVTPQGSFAVLTAAVDPLFDDSLNRPALAQTFSGPDGALTVAVNHLKSKSCSNATGDNVDMNDGQACFNASRTDAATALANWLATDPTASNDPDFLIIGDLNAYAMEDPITAIKNAGYTDLIDSLLGVGSYTFEFGGVVGYLDHALATQELASRISAVQTYHINADESEAIEYNEEDVSGLVKPASFFSDEQYRGSDHDPVIIDIISLDPGDPVFADGFETLPVGR